MQISISKCGQNTMAGPKWAKVIECGKLHFPKIHIAVSADRGFPGGASGKGPTCQCSGHRGPGFYPWVGKILWSRNRQPIPVFLPGENSVILQREIETTSHLLNLCRPLWLL